MYCNTFLRASLGVLTGITLTLALGRCGPIAPSVPKGFHGSNAGGAVSDGTPADTTPTPQGGWITSAQLVYNPAAPAPLSIPADSASAVLDSNWDEIGGDVIKALKSAGSYSFSFPNFIVTSIAVKSVVIYAPSTIEQAYLNQNQKQNATLSFDLTQDASDAAKWVFSIHPDPAHADFDQFALSYIQTMEVTISGHAAPAPVVPAPPAAVTNPGAPDSN